MPRTVTVEPPSTAPTSLVASAARIRGGRKMGTMLRNTGADAWHMEAWEHYRRIGEFRYACDWIGAQLSKAIISATVEIDGVSVAVDTPAVVDIISSLFNNADGRAEMFRLIGIHMSVTGECWIVGYPDPDPFGDGGDKWEVAASTKCTRPLTDSDSWKVNDVTLSEVSNDDVMAIRIWRPDPLEPQLSISPARAIMTTLRQLDKLTQYISAQLDSRLAGAGVLLMPTTMSFPAPATEGETVIQKSASSAEDLMTILMEAMARSLEDRDDASALVPIVVTASAEDIAAVKHMTFWSELDQHAMELRNEAIRRLALGMDMPPEVLQGAADANHWSAWQADESSIKSHTEPLLKIITTALGSHYLRPLLTDEDDYDEGARAYDGHPLSKYSIAADTSEMRLRPNRSKEALELYNLGELNGVALRRETGFDENDAMSDEQLATWLTRKVASGSTTPELVEAALKELGVRLSVVRPAADTPEGVGTPTPPPPSLADHPETGIPDRALGERRREARREGRVPSADIARKAALLAAADQLVVRALERAGNRLKNQSGVKFSVPAVELHTVVKAAESHDLLHDAWAHVPRVAERYGEEPLWLEMNLENYCNTIIRGQRKHTWGEFEAFMEKAMEPSEAAA
ncbi:portal protein [Arthrobacter phage SilentRX]|uniref:Portal protein n=1 Tax=Arthrobacter phage SilentRX TaxID=2836091 RepID=A0A8F3INK6_9CAUD|nr:portal protein [Arthrobacter phage SilentRX]QWY82760.1 portal protein [Arthrobacter phage SilentRX]